ncbi:AI-2E family transporter [Stutzerimonas tarimensis]|uniref:AI-2E family transporter n=1 Tax=Stutzerimonas tarimensis TaxID=1507735 RepID=A0ABV7T320_9GAMM
MSQLSLEHKTFLGLLVAVSIAFAWILLPYYGAVFWAVILAIIFAPVQRWLDQRLPHKRNLTALLTLLSCLLLAVLPMILITNLLVQQAVDIYTRIQEGDLNFGAYFNQAREYLPQPVQVQIERMGWSDPDSIRERLTSGLGFIASKAFSFGQGTFQFFISFFVMLYLLFFLIRDGRVLVYRVRSAIPLSDEQKYKLFAKFTRVVRATVKGNIVIALIQGALGGIIFVILGIPGAVLWGVIMAILSLLPAVGAALVWGPVVIVFLMNGQIMPAVILTLFGVLVIGLVDNLLRPILVGKDTKMPDFMVLISTLGGLALFGLNGFVIGPLVAALFISCWALFIGLDHDQLEGKSGPSHLGK